MPVDPSYLDRILLRLNLAPQLLREVMAAGTLKAVVLASKLGIFEELSKTSLTSEEIAARVKADSRGIRILLDLLASSGYLRKGSGTYSLSSQSSKWLSRSSTVSLSDMASVWDSKVLKFWDLQIEHAVRNGRPSQDIFEWFDSEPDAWSLFNSFEMAIARWVGGSIAKSVRLPPGSKRLVDVGGGHGLFSILFCQHHPELTATILDKPEPLRTAKDNIQREHMGERVSVKSWDLRTDPIEGGYDCALLFNLIHNFSVETNRDLLTKVNRALSPSGLVIIWDNSRGPGRLINAAFDFFSLAYLVGTGGQTYTARDISNWLGETGFSKHRRYRAVPGLITAVKS